MRTLTCTCWKTAEVHSSSNLGELARESGFTPIISGSCETFWICPECYKKVEELAVALYKIVPDTALTLCGILYRAGVVKDRA